MLNPESRLIYLDELKPPPGYFLDRAVGTTFSLDLMTLLIAPLAMVFYEWQEGDRDLGSRVEVIEALRRVSGNLAIFCQKGRIAVPKQATLLYSYLEPVVVEVQPEGGGVFHPKTWLLRFTAKDQPVIYRFLCLSRNLTFDNSWDTVLSLEGELQEHRKVGYSINGPLRDFVRALPGLAQRELSPQIRDNIELMAEEAGRVIFEAPPGFNRDFAFVPSGIKGYRYPRLFGKKCSRLALISPFVSYDWLMQGPPAGRDHNLITREESLDVLSRQQYEALSERYSLYTMHDTAQSPDGERTDEVLPSPAGEDRSGLHAKLYVVEDGGAVSLATGSANATNAAFRGRNVEFMVKLYGRKRRCGIDSLFGSDPDQPFPGKLFQRYEKPAGLQEEVAIQRKLDEILEIARNDLLACDLSGQVHREDKGLYSLVLSAAGWQDSLAAINCSCYPITLKEDYACELKKPGDAGQIAFSGLPPASLTSFIAFRLKARYEGREGALTFVLSLPVEGMPEEREREILYNLIKSREQFIRYLLFLLADEQDIPQLRDLVATVGNGGVKERAPEISLPLFEELVRAYSREPGKIMRIAGLVSELRQSEKGEKLLPEGFRRVWAVIEGARKEEAGHERAGE